MVIKDEEQMEQLDIPGPVTEEEMDKIKYQLEYMFELIKKLSDVETKMFTIENAFEYIQQTAYLFQHGKEVCVRGRVPKYSHGSAIMSIAANRGFTYLQRIGLFVHLNQFEAFIKLITDKFPQYARPSIVLPEVTGNKQNG